MNRSCALIVLMLLAGAGCCLSAPVEGTLQLPGVGAPQSNTLPNGRSLVLTILHTKLLLASASSNLEQRHIPLPAIVLSALPLKRTIGSSARCVLRLQTLTRW